MPRQRNYDVIYDVAQCEKDKLKDIKKGGARENYGPHVKFSQGRLM
jgi:hypothetical protein